MSYFFLLIHLCRVQRGIWKLYGFCMESQEKIYRRHSKKRKSMPKISPAVNRGTSTVCEGGRIWNDPRVLPPLPNVFLPKLKGLIDKLLRFTVCKQVKGHFIHSLDSHRVQFTTRLTVTQWIKQYLISKMAASWFTFKYNICSGKNIILLPFNQFHLFFPFEPPGVHIL